MPIPQKAEVLSVRFDPARKTQLRVAASLTGLSVSGFVRAAAEREARAVLSAEFQPEAETSSVEEPRVGAAAGGLLP